ncbi:MAG: hypothetical protein L0Y56_17215 [Nitrospira sp.]|nr:hypothetical protein [Nitrospira sp.]
MKRLVLILLISLFIPLIPLIASSQVKVKGYTRKDGTYVQPHERTSPNKTKMDNYSTKGNTNPHTGKNGTKDPFPESGSITRTRRSSDGSRTFKY